MSYFHFRNVKIAGFSAGIPKEIITNETLEVSDYTAEDFVEATGINSRRVSNELTTSDLCYEAAVSLLADLNWAKSEIGIIVFVSQTPDYIEPATACILQERLGFNKECYAIDVSMGCSGWVYGLSSILPLLTSGNIKKGLLMVGDAKRRYNYFDPLFGHAGTVTALEYQEGNDGFKFHFGTDGSGYNAIIIPDGGSRNQVNIHSFDLENVGGKLLNRLQTRMNGMDVFSFGISIAPKSVKNLIEHFNLNIENFDYFIFHQANLMMNEKIRKKLKLDKDKVPMSLYEFGNTSSASIPLTIISQLKGKIEEKNTSFICCGFGVGLSWGTVAFDTSNIIISKLVEL